MRYGVLGPIEVHDGERLVRVGGPQQQRLLGVLLSQPGQVIETNRFVEALWPDGRAPDAAIHSVLTYIHRLRTALGDGSIVTHGSGYSIEVGSGELDIDTFEALVAQARASPPDAAATLYGRALALWRGRAFGPLGEEWWALGLARRVEELRVVAAEERAAGLIATGDRARAVAELHALVAEQPLRERPVCLLAESLHATGRQVDALREFRSFRARLADVSGLVPSDELTELERAIARGEVSSGSSTAGRPLRGYVIHDAIGEGGFGRVYVATQPGTNRRVAIKVIRADLADSEEFVRRFEVEAQLVARLEHPHIVPLYDYWREPGGAYLVFRLLKRSASASLVTGGPWTLAHVSQLVEEVGGALLAAHAAGVTHGDVRAANVLLDEAGSSYLTDFGIAIAHDEAGVGESGPAEADIEGFASLLWELLAGTSPDPRVSAWQHGDRRERRRLSTLAGRVPAVPDSIDAVLAEATDPATCFESMAEFILAWRAAVGRPEGVVTPLEPGAHAGESARRLAARELIAEAAAGINPYQGLRPFAEPDAGRYFGRADVIDALHETVRRQRFVAVVGSSGSGKSSLVHAGLAPRLRHDDSWIIATMVPGERPVAALRDSLTEIALEPIRRRAPGEAIAMVASAAGGLVLIVDQLEECWTLAAADEREAFLEALAAAATMSSASPIHVVVTVRADFYDRPLQHPVLGQLVSEGTVALPPMTPSELEDAVVLPAAQAGVSFGDGVVAAIVAEAVVWPGALPMLQFTLAELYERRVDGRITAACLDALGGIAGAVGQRAEAVFDQFDPAGRSSVRDVFARLVTPGQGAADTRRRARLGELPAAGAVAVDRFVDARLLVSDREVATREPVVEVAHEALLTRWPRLRDWVDEDRRWLGQLQHLAAAARSWDLAGRPESELYRGSRLEAAIEALPDRANELTDVEAAFIHAGQAVRDLSVDRERRSARRLRRLLVAVAVLLIAALVGGLIAYQQRQTAQRNERVAQREEREAALTALTSSAAALRSNRVDLAALLAVEAHRMAPSAATRSALFGTFTTSPGLMRIVHTDLEATGVNLDVSVIPDTDVMVVQDAFGGADVIDTTSGVRTHLEGPVEEPGYAWFFVSADGRYAASIWNPHTAAENDADNYGVLTAWDLSTGERRFEPVRTPFAPARMAISADGSMVAASEMESGAVELYDGANGEPLTNVDALPRPERFDGVGSTAPLAFLPEGNLVIGSMAGPLRIVNPADGTEVARIESPPLTTNNFLWLTRDATHAVTLGHSSWEGNWDTPISAFDLEAGRRVQPEPTPMHTNCNQYRYAEQIGAILCATWGGRVLALDVTTGAEIDRPLDPQQGPVCGLAVTPDATRLIELTSCLDRAAAFAEWRLDGGGPVSGLVVDAPTPEPSYTVGFGYGGDDSALVVEFATPPDEQPVTHVIDAASGDVLERFPGVYGLFSTADPDVAIAIFDEDGTVGLFDLARRERVGPTIDPGFEIQGVWTSGNRVFLKGPGDDGGINLRGFDLDSGAPLGPVVNADDGWDVIDVVIVDDVMYTVEVGPRWRIQRRDATTGDVIGDSADDYRNVTSNGQITVASTVSGRIFQADPITLQPIGTPFPGTTGPASGLQLSRDGTLLMVRGDDETLHFYDVATRTPLGDPIDLDRFFMESGAVLRPDGLQAAAVTKQGIVVWDLDPDHWIVAACRTAGRNLTHDEWNQYIGDLAPYRRTCLDHPAA